MSELEQLPPDQQAVLSLLVRQGQTYAQVAKLLAVDEATIRRRARLAIDGLGGSAPSELGTDTAGQVTDYLLGQQDASGRIETLGLLSDSAATRAWARGIASELAPIASVALPSVPDEPELSVAAARPSSPPERRDRRRARRPPDDAVDRRPDDTAAADTAAADEAPTDRRDVNRGGGVLLIAGVLVIAAIVVFIVASGGSSTPARGPIPNSAATATSTTAGTSDVVAEVTLKATAAGSKATGEVEVIKDGSSDELAFSAAHLAAPGKGHYVLVLYNSSTKYKVLGEVPSVSSSGSVGPLAVTLPSDASSYHGVVLTLDSSDSASSPGSVVLTGTSSSGF